VLGVAVGSTAEEVLKAVGQPHSRLGNEFTYCTRTGGGAERTVAVTFDENGKVEATS